MITKQELEHKWTQTLFHSDTEESNRFEANDLIRERYENMRLNTY